MIINPDGKYNIISVSNQEFIYEYEKVEKLVESQSNNIDSSKNSNANVDIKSPETGDVVVKYISLFIIGLVFLACTVKIRKRYN